MDTNKFLAQMDKFDKTSLYVGWLERGQIISTLQKRVTRLREENARLRHVPKYTKSEEKYLQIMNEIYSDFWDV